MERMNEIQEREWGSAFLARVKPIQVHTRVLVFDFGDERNVPREWSIPLLRGVWGNALHEQDRRIYESVFEGPGGKTNRLPLYLIRNDLDSAGRPRRFVPGKRSVQWTVFCQESAVDEIFFRAWEAVCRNGLGEWRNTCGIAHVETYSKSIPDPSFIEAESPCRIVFTDPLRLIRKGVLNQKPTLRDIIQAALNRLAYLRAAAVCGNRGELILPAVPGTLLPDFAQSILEFTHTIPSEPWYGLKHDLRRYSGRQKSEIRLNGTAGWLTFPSGLGQLSPILGAALVTHVGKGSVYGMGRPFLLTLDE